MEVQETYLKGCFIITPNIFDDERGYFFESFNKDKFETLAGISIDFVQDNQSKSSKGVLRGLHYQIGEHEQAKLVRVITGSVLDVCVDLRKNSETFGQYFSMILDDKTHHQLFIPRGFAHGFLVLEDNTIFSYKCDNYYSKEAESGIRFDDKYLNIEWRFPKEKLLLSPKDLDLPEFQDIFQNI